MQDEYAHAPERNLLLEDPIPSLSLEPPYKNTLQSIEVLILSLTPTVPSRSPQFSQSALPFKGHSLIPNVMEVVPL